MLPSEEEGPAGLSVPGPKHEFKAPPPRASLLGLDRLAAAKRAEQSSSAGASARVSSLHEDEDHEQDPSKPPRRPSARQSRPYRDSHLATPSHPGRSEREARDLLDARQAAHRERALRGPLAATTRDGGRRGPRGEELRRGEEWGRRRDAVDSGRPSDRSRENYRSSPRARRDRSRSPSRSRRGSSRSPSRSRRGSSRSPSRARRDRSRSPSRRPSSRGWEDTPARGGGGSKRSEWDLTPARDRGRGEDPSRSSARGASFGSRSSRGPLPPASPALTPSWRARGASSGGEAAQVSASSREEAEEEGRRLDRAWYDQEDSGAAADDEHNPFSAYAQDERLAEREAAYKRRAAALEADRMRRDGTRMSLAQAHRASAMQKDLDAWEQNRLLSAGAARAGEREMEFDPEADARVLLVVQDARPPFLKGALAAGRLQGPVLPLKDPTSDLAVIARSGSKLVKEVREKREANRGRARFWEVAGSKMGAATGLTAEEREQQAAAERAMLEAEGVGQEEEGGGEEGDGGGKNPDGPAKKQAGFFKHVKKHRPGVSEFARTRTLGEQRRSLPVYGVREELLDAVRENQIVVVVGETGSGKTTQMTQYLVESGLARRGCVACTQPRRVAAMSVAARVAEEMGVELGREVGYSIRFEDVTSEDTIIKYMTDGVLLRETMVDAELDRYAAVIMDEAHERSLNTDVLFGVLRRVVARRRDFRLVVTSATLDAGRFAEFFGGVPVFRIPGRTFPVDVLFSKTPQEDYVEAAVKQAVAIHLGHPRGDVLIFLTGQEEIEACCWALQERLERLGEDVPPALILPLYSQLPADLQARIFDPAPEGARKIVVATNVAETSLTLDGILYVIDTGFIKVKVYTPKLGMDALAVFPESQSAAAQRSGRAGRTGPGTCWRLFTESAFRGEMLAASVPEIQRTNLANTVLLLKTLGVHDVAAFDFMDPPPAPNVAHSLLQLWTLGALDQEGRLTALGRRMAQFPLDPPLARLLLAAAEEGCTEEALTIVAMLSVPPVFFRPPDRAAESDAAREKFFVAESDHLTLLHVYQQWKAHAYRTDWCVAHFLQAKGLRKAKEVRAQLLDIVGQQRLPLTSSGRDWDPVRRAICAAYFWQAARIKGVGEYVNCRTGMACHLHPTSALYGLGHTPDYVVYHELVATAKEYMQCVTMVEPEWLAEMGPMFFSVKEGLGGGGGGKPEAAPPTPATPATPASAQGETETPDAAEALQRKLTGQRTRADIATPGRGGVGARRASAL